MNINELIEKEGRDYMYSPKAHTGHYTDVQIEEYRYDGFVDGANFALSQFRWREVEEELPEVDTDVYLKGLNFDEEDYDVGYLHTGDNHMFICGRLTKVTHWMPIPE